MLNNSLNNLTVLVTGGTRGIGCAIVEVFLDQGATVIYTGIKKEDPNKNNRAKYVQLDFCSDESVAQALETILSHHRIDILINNAGINIIEPIDQLKEEHWDRIFKVNLKGSAWLIKEFSRHMIDQGIKGKVLNISSIFGVVSRAKRASYSSSKSGILGLTRASALDLAPHQILVNALSPGFTDTELTREVLGEEGMRELAQQIPLKRCADVKEIAHWALFLCSPHNSYITGQNFVVDGGFIIQ
ncbi:MAG: SDR family NAD(P)-dependent oxidoreductase [Candidatus Omnitrophica bacterium]|nr:SDR family NAD(P)-dependent oxidoreductase [Candidatus Omnitrophota bacterium]